MSENTRISLFEVVGSPLCVASDDGQKIYDRLASILKADLAVRLSFHNVTALTGAFLNVPRLVSYMEHSVKKKSVLC